ncbi:hypothetical protein [Streptomyces aidingensis]|uniref:Exonuclease domain-containing protein n=1 Tax=Streptomyces aidingensis TaxID=910347 RepID=A0A1I1Q516_9ACTN|nr:hypothetical protein [Streptomyces aidingensis]SFD13230.1 hypothetical protein SAMN05421773_11046 [Streptomyces aidingensis]
MNTTTAAPLISLDTETTGLVPGHHMPWEIAIIRREPDGTDTEHLFQIRPSDAHLRHVADPESLKINRFAERFAIPDGHDAADMLTGNSPAPLSFFEACARIHALLSGAVVIGSNPSFDTAHLSHLLGVGPGRPEPWHYRVVDVADRAAGYLTGLGPQRSGLTPPKHATLITPPFSSKALSRAVGVEPPGDGDAHTALADAKWAMAVYDAVTAGGAR